MRAHPLPSLVASLALLAAVAAVPASAVVEEDPAAASTAWVDAIIELTKDVRVTDADVKMVLEHHASLEAAEDQEDDDEEAWAKPGGPAAIAADPRFRAWAAGRGLGADDYLGKWMRLTAFLMRDEVLDDLREAESQLPAQRAQVEAARAQIGEAGVAQALASIDGAIVMLKATRAAFERLPVPTADEAQVLARHRAELESVLDLGDDDDDDEDGDEDDD